MASQRLVVSTNKRARDGALVSLQPLPSLSHGQQQSEKCKRTVTVSLARGRQCGMRAPVCEQQYPPLTMVAGNPAQRTAGTRSIT